jgi:hypothetical protein
MSASGRETVIPSTLGTGGSRIILLCQALAQPELTQVMIYITGLVTIGIVWLSGINSTKPLEHHIY